TGRSELLAEPAEWGDLSPRGADAAESDRLGGRVAEQPRGRERAVGTTITEQPGDDPSRDDQYRRQSLQCPAGVRRVSERPRPESGRGCSGGGPGGCRCEEGSPPWNVHHDARAGPEHAVLVLGAGARAPLRTRAGVSPDGGQFSVLDRPAHHYHGTAGRNVRCPLGAVRDAD